MNEPSFWMKNLPEKRQKVNINDLKYELNINYRLIKLINFSKKT